jgi:uncharacterized protein YecT (DUF1311 family)
MSRLMSVLSVCVVLFCADVAQAEQETERFVPGDAPGKFWPVSTEQLEAIESYDLGQRIVGTHFFYWYDIRSKEHFVNRDGSDALTDHPTRTDDYSYNSVDWWKRELQDVTAAGIDFILPVYWGCPGSYDSWSFAGLPPLVQAWEQLQAEGRRPPRVGLFYDTSTLRHNPQRWHVDLSTDAGKQWFYATIRDYFSFIPPKMWAAIDAKPIVVLYGANFAAKQDEALFPYVREHFRHDFSSDMFLVKNLGWQGKANAECSWGGALGLKAYSVASLGPGYDHSAVPNRKPLVVDREGGDFYAGLWKQFLSLNVRRRANIVLVETWNELHEGTDVCDSKEYGRQYIQMTAKYADLFREGTQLSKIGPFAQSKQIAWIADRPNDQQGIVVRNAGDGLMEPTRIAGHMCWRTKQSQHRGKYVYVDLDDSFMFDEENATVRVMFEYLDRGFGSFLVEFDSNDPKSSVREGAFHPLNRKVECHGTGVWEAAALTIDDCRFANRCNGGDLRLAVTGGDLAVRKIVVMRVMASSD